MDASEFRINNLVSTLQGVFRVIGVFENTLAISPFLTAEPFQVEYKDVIPILITEEWLLRFGFYKDELDDFRNVTRLRISFHIDRFIFFCDNGLIRDVKYIHELQNIHHCFTSEELTLNGLPNG